jgi:hypothetical protein
VVRREGAAEEGPAGHRCRTLELRGASRRAQPAEQGDRACGCGFVARTHLKSALGAVCSSAPSLLSSLEN